MSAPALENISDRPQPRRSDSGRRVEGYRRTLEPDAARFIGFTARRPPQGAEGRLFQFWLIMTLRDELLRRWPLRTRSGRDYRRYRAPPGAKTYTRPLPGAG